MWNSLATSREQSSKGAMTGSDAFFFPSYEETEGIVVLEALASHQHTVLRDIPVYNGWIDETSSELYPQCRRICGFLEQGLERTSRQAGGRLQGR